MKNLLIIYEFDEEYIKRVLSFFKFFSIKEGLSLNFYAKRWSEKKLLEETIFIDENFNLCKEKIKNFKFFHSSIILSLNPEIEHQNHKEISEYLKKYKINQLNPFSVSSFASNKYKVIEKFKNLNLLVPYVILVELKDRKNLKEKIERFIMDKNVKGFYIQPNFGTEGKQTYFFTKSEIIENFDFFQKTILSILPEQPVIIKEKRGNVYYYDEKEKIKGFRDIVFRIFVFEWNKKIISNWYFIEICPEEKKPISSPYQGGIISDLDKVKENIYYRVDQDFKRFVLTEKNKIQIISEAKKIFKLLNKGRKEKLKIAGIDILFETDGKNLNLIFLEINPRPSGLDKLNYLVYLSQT